MSKALCTADGAMKAPAVTTAMMRAEAMNTPQLMGCPEGSGVSGASVGSEGSGSVGAGLGEGTVGDSTSRAVASEPVGSGLPFAGGSMLM